MSASPISVGQDLAVGEYYRPTGDEVSGRVGATTPYVRSPCPALNTLANHGYLPRDGHNITHDHLRTALHDVFNFGDNLINQLVSGVPEKLSLADLSEHNFIEHDASLVHNDASTGRDPASLNDDLWRKMFSHAKNDKFGARELATVRRDCIKQSKEKPSGSDFGVKQRFIALGEAAFLLRALGGGNVESISVEFAKTFLMNERIPATYKKPPTPVGVAGTLVTAVKIQIISIFQSIGAMFH